MCDYVPMGVISIQRDAQACLDQGIGTSVKSLITESYGKGRVWTPRRRIVTARGTQHSRSVSRSTLSISFILHVPSPINLGRMDLGTFADSTPSRQRSVFRTGAGIVGERLARAAPSSKMRGTVCPPEEPISSNYLLPT